MADCNNRVRIAVSVGGSLAVFVHVQCLLLSPHHAPGPAASFRHSGGLLAAPSGGASPAGAPPGAGDTYCKQAPDSNSCKHLRPVSPFALLVAPCNLQVHYLEESASEYVRSAVDTAVSIHRDGMPGDILLLLPGRAALAT
jgi:hypothetical protein